MAVAALSTAALALTAGPASTPAPAQGADNPIAFAKLVTEASPDGKTAQDEASAGSGRDSEADASITAEDIAAPAEGEAVEQVADKPVDLLAQIEAMVAAAGQLSVRQPAPAPVAVQTQPVPEAATAEPAIVATTAAPHFAMPGSARFARQATIVSPPTRQAAMPAPEAPISAPMTAEAAVRPAPMAVPTQAGQAPTAASTTPVSALPSAEAVATAGAGAGPKPIPTDIAAMIASLKAAFEPSRSGVESVSAMPAQADTPVATAPLSAAPAPDTIIAITATPPAAVITVARVATSEAALLATPEPEPAPAPAPVATVEPTATATPVVAERAPLSIDPTIIKAIAAEMLAAPAQPAKAVPAAAVAPATKGGDTPIAPLDDLVQPAINTAAPTTPRAARLATEAAEAAEMTPADKAATADLPDAVDVPELPATPGPAETLAAAPATRPTEDIDAVPDTAAAPSQADLSVERHLDLARDTQWLDRLARDISQAATQQGHLKFQLNPEHLGALTIEIANSAAGTSIKLTAETDQARQIIADAQPRLLAEVRAQGLRVAESHVDLNQQGSGNSAFAQGQQRQSSEDHKPFARTQTVIREDAGDSAPAEDGELYA